MAKKQKWQKRSWEEKKERVNKITDEMNQAIDSYFETPEQMKEYLSFMSKFYQYSPRNSALIHGQFRGAQAVGSFKFWQEKGFSVQKGEKGIKVLVPNKIPPKFKDESGKWKNIKYATDKQKEQIEKGELQRKVSRLYFSLGHVFDVSQTNAKASDLPEIFPNRWMEGQVENYGLIMDSLNKIGKELNVTIGAPLDELGSAKGAFYYAVDKEGTIGHIGLNPRNSELQNVKTMIHELAHAKLHSGEKGLQMTSEEKEFQAEMVAYATASYFGIDTSEYSLKYLADWTKGKELDDKTKLLSEVRETSVGFIHAIEQDLIKERERYVQLPDNEKNMLLIKGEYFKTENKYVTIQELRNMVAEEKEKIVSENENSDADLNIKQEKFINHAEQLLNNKDLTSVQFSKIFNQMYNERYTVVDKETIKRPSVVIKWSEAWPEENIVLPFNRANKKMENHIKEIEEAKHMAEKKGQYVGYDKTRYHVILPNDKGEVDVINMDRLDMGDGEFKSPYDQILKDENLTDTQKVILHNEVTGQALNENTLTEIKESYIEFATSEYSTDADEENLQLLKSKANEIDLISVIPVAYTTVGDNDEFELQVSLNLEEKRLERFISGEYVNEEEYDAYDSYEAIIDDIKEWNFDNLIENNFDYEELEQKENETRHKLLREEPKEFSMEM